MKTILIFSNPFGNGPNGKAVSIYKYARKHFKNVKIYLCGSPNLLRIAGLKSNFIQIDERNENLISDLIKKIKGEIYIVSSQNRFAIKAAKANNIPCAFLDGLSWFWKKIPGDHFLADIIFWLNYPKITERIPLHFKNNIYIVHGITEQISKKEKSYKKADVLMYLGGCKNPLTAIPNYYLDLVANLIQKVDKEGFKICLVTDPDSQRYLKKYLNISNLTKTYSHEKFILKLSKIEKFISNGGQTATIEAANLNTPIYFFLPINLSQFALVKKLTSEVSGYPNLAWEKYIKIPPKFLDYTEKEAIKFLNFQSKKLHFDKKMFNLLYNDFKKLLLLKENGFTDDFLFRQIGNTGTYDICKVLESKWNLS